MPNTPDTIRTFLQQMKEHPAYKANSEVHIVVDYYQAICATNPITDNLANAVMKEIQIELKKILNGNGTYAKVNLDKDSQSPPKKT